MADHGCRVVGGGAEVSQATTGAENIFMGRFRVPAGAQWMPHYHADCESAVYMLSGRLNVRWGEGLQHALSLEPGDMVYVPPRETHLLENPSDGAGRRVRRRPRRARGALRRRALGDVAPRPPAVGQRLNEKFDSTTSTSAPSVGGAPLFSQRLMWVRSLPGRGTSAPRSAMRRSLAGCRAAREVDALARPRERVDRRCRERLQEALEIAGAVPGLHDVLRVGRIPGVAPAGDLDVDLAVVVLPGRRPT